MKVIQIKPPESDEEHYSFDSKERNSNQLQQKNAANVMMSQNDSVKAFKVVDTPADGMDDIMLFPEAPLQEEPMPEQKSFKNISPK